MGDTSELLNRWSGGDQDAGHEVIVLLLDELKIMARRLMRGEREDHTLQATELLHEVYLKLHGYKIRWNDRKHFLAIATKATRQILVDHARYRTRQKRPGGFSHVPVEQADFVVRRPTLKPEMVLAVHGALDELEQAAPRQRTMVELRFFAGLTIKECAAVLEVSEETVRKDWIKARLWLKKILKDDLS